MKLLLDTHTLLWWLSDDPALGAHGRDRIADPANTVSVSVVSLWEVLMKVRAGKLVAAIDDILEAVRSQGFDLLGIRPAHLRALAALPAYHKDPFDHLLIAQAVAEDATFLSDDRFTARYPVRCESSAGSILRGV